ncbi:hypothetical protein DSM104299_04479 [Baekduia alba]|uniref:hypothetical protein n=1 Tax=Baekduia alba TaxID=2997333 RepID=UPI002341D427|nr:hypothetical protein [Baekduia alba]WCB95730.1 hypothetical protein DSM104299_04479 [Baekduia alba]
MKLRRLVALATVALAATTSLAACGSDSEPTAGKTEGVYVNTGDLAYQVQISRQLNEKDFEDRDYLTGLPVGARLAPNQEWFAVFVRVFNRTKAPHEAASQFVIRDTTGKEYQPVALNTNINRVAYHANVVDGGDQIPVPGSLARENLTQGGLILFKVENSSYASRPLELDITPPDGGKSATVDLDV